MLSSRLPARHAAAASTCREQRPSTPSVPPSPSYDMAYEIFDGQHISTAALEHQRRCQRDGGDGRADTGSSRG